MKGILDWLNFSWLIDKVMTFFSGFIGMVVKFYSSIPKELRLLIGLAFLTLCLYFVLWSIKNRHEWKRRDFG